MLGAEKVADMFDALHEENKQAIKQGFQGWVDDIYLKEGESASFYGAAVVAGVLDTLYTFAGNMGAGLVDLTRLGEGVKKGTVWGVAQDGLRVVSIVGGAFRVVRVAAAELKLGGQMSCVLSSSAKAAALGGYGRVATFVTRLSKPLGGRAAVFGSNFGGLNFRQFVRGLTSNGMRGTWKTGLKSLDEVVAFTKEARGPVLFDMRWNAGGGHTMVAFRDLLGRVRFADQWGATIADVSKLSALGKLNSEAMILHDAAVVSALRFGAVGHFLMTEVYYLPAEVLQKIENAARTNTGRLLSLESVPGDTPNNFPGKAPAATAPVPSPAGVSASVTPRPYKGPVSGSLEFVYAGGITGHPILGQVYQVRIQFSIAGKTFNSVVPYKTAKISGQSFRMVSTNTVQLNVAPDGYPALVINPGNILNLQL